MPTPVSHRVRKRRDALRAAGLRPVQIWVPDTRRPGFAAECARQIVNRHPNGPPDRRPKVTPLARG